MKISTAFESPHPALKHVFCYRKEEPQHKNSKILGEGEGDESRRRSSYTKINHNGGYRQRPNLRMSNNVVILDFLTNEVGIDVVSAAALVSKFQQAGHVTSKDLWSMKLDDIKNLVTDTNIRKRIQAAIRRGPNAKKLTSPKKAKQIDSSSCQSDEPPCLPPDELPEDEDLCGCFSVNRSPVMILWASIVAYATGYNWEEALSLASTVAALNAQAKAESIWGQSSSSKKGNQQDNAEFYSDGFKVRKFPNFVRNGGD